MIITKVGRLNNSLLNPIFIVEIQSRNARIAFAIGNLVEIIRRVFSLGIPGGIIVYILGLVSFTIK